MRSNRAGGTSFFIKNDLQYKRAITTEEIASELFREFIGNRDREVFAIIGVDIAKQPTFFNIVSIGHLSATGVNMRELVKPVILSSSAGIFVGHNHPGGTLKASQEDIIVTERIRDCGAIFGIELIDHIIVTDAVSIRSRMPELF